MIQDILRIIRKGKNDKIVNLKIREFHKEEFDLKNNEILSEYDRILAEIIEEIENYGNTESLDIKKEELEIENTWLLNVSENGYIQLPIFNMSDEEVQSYRKLNAVVFRANNYAPMGEQMAMQYDDKINDTTTWISHILDVKVRWPKN